jgi:nucleotide-binding universal stress UspA family protein
MFESILVPLDGSVFAEQALPLAVSMARQTKASLRLLRVISPLEDVFFWAPLPGTSLETDLRKQNRIEAQAYLDGVISRLKHLADCRVICDVMEEQEGISESICADVAKTGSDLIVLTSHGRGAVARFWLGSIADQLVRTAPVPVLLVRPPEHPSAPDFTRPVIVKHLLLALGGKTTTERIVEPAVAIGKVAGADYTLVRVVQPTLYPLSQDGDLGAQPGAWEFDSGRIDIQKRQKADEYLGVVAGRLRAEGAKVQTSVPFSGQPAAAILEEAARVGADLIALEAHGRGASRVLMGSVADKVVRGSHIPVLVCRVPRDVS